MLRLIFTSAVVTGLAVPLPALAQVLISPQPFAAHASVMVENDSPVPQTVAGTSVAPFQLLPHQQAELDMSAVPPSASLSPNGRAPVRFEYSVGQSSGPMCRGTIDVDIETQGEGSQYQVTDCSAHSLGTGGGHCEIAVNAENAVCHGALAFSAR